MREHIAYILIGIGISIAVWTIAQVWKLGRMR